MIDKEFEFKEVDDEGLETLEAIRRADNLNGWMYESMVPYTRGRILEIGSGIGNISQFFLKAGADITLSDLRDNYKDALYERFGTKIRIIILDLVHPDFEQIYSEHLGGFDCVFALNVVEHIKDDALAISNANKLLKPGGNFIVLVPAYSSLYNEFDRQLLHYRRYHLSKLKLLFTQNEFQVIRGFYFNFIGIFGWFLSGKMGNHKTIPKGHVTLYNKLVPLFRWVDMIIGRRMGLSVVAVGRKK